MRDRGTIKWTSLMLPEHVQMINEAFKEQERVEKPILDEQQIEENSFALQRAMKDGFSVEIKYHNGFEFVYLSAKIKGIDVNTKKVKCIEKLNKKSFMINFDDICEVTVL